MRLRCASALLCALRESAKILLEALQNPGQQDPDQRLRVLKFIQNLGEKGRFALKTLRKLYQEEKDYWMKAQLKKVLEKLSKQEHR